MEHRPPFRRRRPARSCIECRRRKIKCDRAEPCAHCVANKTRCTYRVFADASARNTFSPQSSPARTEGISVTHSAVATPAARTQQVTSAGSSMERTADSESNLPWAAAASGKVGPSMESHDEEMSDAPGQRPRDESDVLRQILQRLKKLEDKRPEADQNVRAPQTESQDAQMVLNKTRILRWSHWYGTVKEFETVVACYQEYIGSSASSSTESSSQNSEIRAHAIRIDELIKACKDIARRLKSSRPSRSISHLGFNLSPPDRDTANKMIGTYLQEWESAFRIVHIPSFQIEYERFMNDPETLTTGRRLKILLAIGIGASVLEDTDANFRSMVHHWIYAAQTWLSGPLEKDRLNVTGIQVYCLLILARQIFSIGGDLVWTSTGSLVHMAMQIGLHRDPSHFPVMSKLQAEVRRRLWATVVEFTLQASLDSALPPRISLDEFDTRAPANISDDALGTEEASTDSSAHDTTLPPCKHTTASVQLILVDSLPTRLNILQLLDAANHGISYQKVLVLSSEIENSLRSSVALMKKAHARSSIPGSEGSGTTIFQACLVDYLVRRFLLPLHCHFAIKARTDPLFAHSWNISVDTSSALLYPGPSDRFAQLMKLGGGMFRESIRCASSVVAVELLAQVESQRLGGTLHRGPQRRGYLKETLEDLLSSALTRIRYGETNVKSPMFLKMVLAQVEAAEREKPCKLMIAESARDSLESCHEILKSLAGTAMPQDVNVGNPTPASIGDELDCAWMDWNLDSFLPSDSLFLES